MIIEDYRENTTISYRVELKTLILFKENRGNLRNLSHI
jgi:hypothetical protein